MTFLRMWGLGTLLALLAGCCEHPLHQQRVAQRMQNLQRTRDTLMEIEAVRPDKLEKTCDLLTQINDQDIQRCQQNVDNVEKFFQRDIDRWFMRQDYYRRGLEREFGGDCESIDRTLPLVLY